MKKISFIIILLLFLCGCSVNEEIVNKTQEQYKEVFSENNYVIVDVRSKHEYAASHVIEAINIPLIEINENIDLDKSKTIFVYCYSGSRSKKAYDLLTSYGFTVYDLGSYDSITLDKIHS